MLIWGVGIVIASIRQWWRGRDIRRIRETLQPIDEAQLPGDLLAHVANKAGINSAGLRIYFSNSTIAWPMASPTFI